MNYDNTDSHAQTPSMSEADLRRTAELLMQQMESRSGSARTSLPQEHKTEEKAEFTINLVELMFYLISKLHYVVIGMVVGAVLMGNYAVRISVPIYTATAKLYIVGQKSNSIVSFSDLQMGTALTNDYQEVFRAWEVHALVNEQLGTDYPISTLQGMLTVQNPEGTRLLYLTVRHTDAQLAADIANAYINAGKQFITQTMATEEPRLFSNALVPTYASSTSVTGYTLRGFLLGAVLSVGILVLIFLLDNRPKSTDDILQYGGIPTLAVIPANEYLSGKGRKPWRKRGTHNE